VRALSTVLDVSVFLLLVSASVVTLSLAQPPAVTETDVDETATVVTSTTLAVEYEIDGERRRAHGTMATLLARGAVASATVDGKRLSTASNGYRETVRDAARARLAAPDRTQVAVRWRPYDGAPVRGEMVVGPDPPEGVDVHAATTTVPAPVPRANASARTTAGYEGVGRAVAVTVAAGLLPSNRVDASVFRRSPTANVTVSRYRTVAAATGVDVDRPLSEGEMPTAHERVVDGLTETFVADMRERFATPQAAAEAVRTGEARIVIRRWDT